MELRCHVTVMKRYAYVAAFSHLDPVRWMQTGCEEGVDGGFLRENDGRRETGCGCRGESAEGKESGRWGSERRRRRRKQRSEGSVCVVEE